MSPWIRSVVAFSFLVSAGLVACAATDPADPSSDVSDDPSYADPGGKADIYGTDNRTEAFAASSVYREVAKSTALVATRSAMTVDSQGRVRLSGMTWSDKMAGVLGGPLCASEPFRTQPAPGFCSAFLIAPNLVATAGHCVNIKQSCGDIRFVFGFAYEQQAGESDVTTVADDDFYQCAGVIGHLYDQGSQTLQEVMERRLWSDWAVIKLDRDVVGRKPLSLRRSGRPSNNQVIAAVGHPGGIPAKVSAGRILDAAPDLYFNTNLDIYGGNSGSVVVNAQGLAEGIVIRGTGGQSFVKSGSCYASRMCPELGETGGCTGNHVMRIEPILQFVDAEQTVMLGDLHNVAIPDGTGSSEVTKVVDEAGTIRFVTLNAGISHPSPADLRITLVGPNGEQTTIFDHSRLLPVGEGVFSRTTNAFNGLSASGTWRLRVEDTVANGGGFQRINLFNLVIGFGEPVQPAASATFVGTSCRDAGECSFDASAQCLTWGEEGGYCTLSCEGTCPDRAGFATTFCTSLDNGVSGRCVPKAPSTGCGEWPGTTARTADRFVGSSTASPATATVCMP